jgi:hypothetical protein
MLVQWTFNEIFMNFFNDFNGDLVDTCSGCGLQWTLVMDVDFNELLLDLANGLNI